MLCAFPGNVRFWCKAAVGLVRAECLPLTQNGHCGPALPSGEPRTAAALVRAPSPP
jgi:hypothetical protein